MSEISLPPGLESSATNSTPSHVPNGAFSLENILGENHDAVEHPATAIAEKASVGWDEEDTAEIPLADGYCVECEGVYKVED